MSRRVLQLNGTTLMSLIVVQSYCFYIIIVVMSLLWCSTTFSKPVRGSVSVPAVSRVMGGTPERNKKSTKI